MRRREGLGITVAPPETDALMLTRDSTVVEWGSERVELHRGRPPANILAPLGLYAWLPLTHTSDPTRPY